LFFERTIIIFSNLHGDTNTKVGLNLPVIRTPEERFENLPDFSFQANFIEIRNMRIHYIDEGNKKGELILCLHGEPSWAYLYRKMIPKLSENYRVISFDFIGFGRSDKYSTMEEYTYQMHYDTLSGFIEQLKLTDITLVVQDWGGLIGLPYASNKPDRIARLVIMNTGLPSGRSTNEAFLQWRNFVENTPDLPIGQIIEMGVANKEILTPEVIKAYDAPFPDSRYKAGARKWPLMVPINPKDPIAEIMLQTREKLEDWKNPALVMFSDKDPITRGADKFFRKLIPTARDQPEIIIHDAGHFLQEDQGELIAQNIVDFIEQS
jgi:haloalkane dehalogenase